MKNSTAICPKCKRQLRNVNAWHYCAQVSIDELFVDKSDEILLVFDDILQTVSSWPNVAVSATKNCVVFVKHKTFLVIKPMTKFLEVKFYLAEPLEDEQLYKCTVWNSKYECVYRFQNSYQLNAKVFGYLKESYFVS